VEALRVTDFTTAERRGEQPSSSRGDHAHCRGHSAVAALIGAAISGTFRVSRTRANSGQFATPTGSNKIDPSDSSDRLACDGRKVWQLEF